MTSIPGVMSRCARLTATTRSSRISSRRAQCSSFSTASEAAAHMVETFGDSVSVRRQLLDANQVQRLSLTLGRRQLEGQDISETPPRPGTPIPPGYHLVYFTPVGTEDELGADGTDRTFNAPAPFTRRMWAGGKMSWPSGQDDDSSGLTLRVGDEVEEHTRLLSAIAKKSKSVGEMILVEVEKEFRCPRGVAVTDQRSWIFRPEIDTTKASSFGSGPDSIIRQPSKIEDIPPSAQGNDTQFPMRKLFWSPVALFRFSALTFNGHRIHYDEGWSQGVEGHSGPVVHGPLNLINILNYWRDVHGNGARPSSIGYRAMAPLYAGQTYHITTKGGTETNNRGSVEIEAVRDDTVCMKAEITA